MLAGWPDVDHGLPVGLGAGETSLCSRKHVGGESNGGIGDDRPLRGQKSAAVRKEKGWLTTSDLLS